MTVTQSDKLRDHTPENALEPLDPVLRIVAVVGRCFTTQPDEFLGEPVTLSVAEKIGLQTFGPELSNRDVESVSQDVLGGSSRR